MNRNRLRCLIFMALCCDFGIFAKKLISPAANILTDSLHIPGGIGTSFSLMFIVIAAVFIPRFGSATLMGAVQSGIALCMGTVGSMGALAPVGYIVPGLAIDCVLFFTRRLKLERGLGMLIANALAALCACLAANVIVFNLHGVVLLLYSSVALLSGSICGLLAEKVAVKLDPLFGKDENNEKENNNHDNSSSGACNSHTCACTSDNAHA